MLEIDIAGNRQAIAAIKEQIVAAARGDVREYRHKGAGGESGVVGLLTSVVLPFLPNLLELLKIALPHDRNLKIVVNGLELNVRDVGEAKDVINLLKDRGLLKADDK